MTKKASLLGCSMMCACTLLAQPSRAQSAPDKVAPPEAQATNNDQPDDIIVTARKRAERLQDVPSSVAALSGDRLEKQGATSLAQYAGYVPSLNVETLGNPGETRLTLRGIAPIGSGAVVGSYLDDIPVGSSTGRSAGRELGLDILPYDLDRLEVLRGPQGTLYGASTMGGAIKYVTVQPSLVDAHGRVGAEISGVSGAGDAGWAVRGMVNVPVVPDRLAIRVSGYNQRTPGYIDNPTLGREDINDTTQRGLRGIARWAPTSNFDLSLSALYQEVRSDDPAAVWRGTDQKVTIGDLAAGYARSQPFHQRLEIYSATANWSMGGLTLTSASSYQHSRNAIMLDQSYSWSPYFGLLDPSVAGGTSLLDLTVNLRKFTQELRLASPAGNVFDWQVGGFYTRERSTIGQVADARDPSGALIGSLNPFLDDLQHDAYDEVAAFANGTLKLGSRLELNGGVRVARNRQQFDEVLDGVFGFLLLAPPGPPSATNGRSRETVFTYTVGPKLKLSKDVMIYGRVAKGYRPGGPNIAIPNIPTQVSSDTLTNYEVGLKSEFFHHRATLNVAVYQIDWNGIQIGVTDPATNVSYTVNASTARSRGVELESAFMPVKGLRLGLNGSFTDAVLTDDLPPNAPPLGWKRGDRLPLSARWNASATIDYDTALGGKWRAQMGAGYRFMSDRLSDVESSPSALRLKGYSVVDANVGISNERFSVRVFARNLFDARPSLGASLLTDPLTGAPDHVETSILQPRTIGLSIDTRF